MSNRLGWWALKYTINFDNYECGRVRRDSDVDFVTTLPC